MIAVSTGVVDITPPNTYPMAGYAADALRLATGANEPLKARCIVIWADGVPHVILTADILEFRASMHMQIRSAVVGLGVVASAFVLTASHTHNGPYCSKDSIRLFHMG